MSRVYADQIVIGHWIVPPGRTQPVEVLAQLSAPESADYFEFACWDRGRVAVRLHRSEQVDVVPATG